MRILVVHSWGIGDLVMATPMMQSLHHSGHRVDLALTSELNRTVIQEAPFIEQIHLIRHKFEFVRLFHRYDALVVTAGINPRKAKMLNLLIGAKKVFAGYQMPHKHRIEMNFDIVAPLIESRSFAPYVFLYPESQIYRNYIDSMRPNIGFAVGSGTKQRFKRWELKKFIALSKRFEGNKLVFIGPDEEELKSELAEAGDMTLVQEPLEHTIGIVARLDWIVGNDNGIMHIAKAAGTKTFTIFGMTDEKEVGAYDPKRNHDIFLPMECRPCFHATYAKITCPEYRCLYDLSVESVYQAIQRKLND